jgi:hypothetical protein
MSFALSAPVTSYSAPVTKVGWLEPDDISPVTVFLASDAANM